jgi:glutamate formiminotransferase/formiminotetrahydrofolate cyclodeaminase
LVDEDTRAFNKIMSAFGLPKNTDEEKTQRSAAIQEATKYAVQIPFQVMQTAFEALPLCEAMVKEGNPNSISDGAVGALCLRTAIEGAYLNVRINAKDLKDRVFAEEYLKRSENIFNDTILKTQNISIEANKSL